jgi:hypothetical protein
VVSSLRPKEKKVKQEREKLFTRESSQQAKEEREFFLGFLLNTQEESEKRNKLAWIIQRRSMNTDN